MPLSDLILGKPLRSSDERAEQVGAVEGVPIFGLDALSSAGYGPEAALTILIPLSLLSAYYILPITIAIVVLLTIVYFSYLPTIGAYPTGGGSYTVARENLGETAGQLAATVGQTREVICVFGRRHSGPIRARNTRLSCKTTENYQQHGLSAVFRDQQITTSVSTATTLRRHCCGCTEGISRPARLSAPR